MGVIAGFVAGTVFVSPLAAEQTFSVEHNLSVRQEFYGATDDQLPLWLHANKFGTVPTDAPVSVTSGTYGVRIGLGEYTFVDSTLDIGFAMTDSKPQFQLRQADVGISWRALELRAGKFPYTRGETPFPELTSGSMVISGNATPIPMVQLAVPDFVPVPRTKGMLNIRGGLTNGWFTGDRFVQDILLHEKWLYLGFGNDDVPVSLYGGLIHESMWAGTSSYYGDENQPAPATLENFVRVFFNDEGGEDGPAGESKYRIGNSLGAWDVGFRVGIGWAEIHAYHQHFFEDGTGLWLDNRMDGLSGIGISFSDVPRGFPNKLLHERIYTTDQGGPYHDVVLNDGTVFHPGGRDSNYYHSIYKNGWSYEERILGTPLFVLLGKGHDARIASNRIKAQHWAFSGDISERFRYRFFTTHAWHYPAYSVRSVADREAVPLWQWHHMVELQHNGFGRLDQLSGTLSFAFDVGQVYDESFGVGLSLRWDY